MCDVDEERPISLCADCAVHPEIISLIKEDAAAGLCGICGNENARVSNPEKFRELKMLIRALVRFYWDEHAYNRHWGGDSLQEILAEPGNPLLRPPATLEYLDDFFETLEGDPYPPADEGVAVYAGFDDGVRLLNFALSRQVPRELMDLKRRLQRENFFQVEGGPGCVASYLYRRA